MPNKDKLNQIWDNNVRFATIGRFGVAGPPFYSSSTRPSDARALDARLFAKACARGCSPTLGRNTRARFIALHLRQLQYLRPIIKHGDSPAGHPGRASQRHR